MDEDLLVFLLVFGGAFIASLFACRNWISRFCFTVLMPALYALIWLVAYFGIGSVIAFVTPEADQVLWAAATRWVSGLIAIGVFLIQVRSMSSDPKHKVYGYSIGRRQAARRAREVSMAALPTQRRWMWR